MVKKIELKEQKPGHRFTIEIKNGRLFGMACSPQWKGKNIIVEIFARTLDANTQATIDAEQSKVNVRYHSGKIVLTFDKIPNVIKGEVF